MTRHFSRLLDEGGLSGFLLAAGATTSALLVYLATAQAWFYEQALLYLAVLIVGGVLLYPVIARPVLGLALFAPVAILPPIAFGPSDASVAFFAAPALVTLWMLSRLSKEGGVRLMACPPFKPMAWLIVIVSIAFVLGHYRWFGVAGAPLHARLGGLAVFVSSAAVFLMAAHEMRNLLWLKRAVWCLLGVGAVVLVSAALMELGVIRSGLIVHEKVVGSMFWTWLLALSFSQGLINSRLSAGMRLLCLLIAAGVLALTMGRWMEWASGWAPGCVALGVILALYRPRLALAAGLIGGMLLVGNATVARDLAWSDDQAYSTKTRAAAAETLLSIAKENPVIGFGPANYYFYTPLFPILGWYVRFSSHNNYFDLILQTGLCGLLCVFWLWFELGRYSWLARPFTRPGFERAYLYGAMGGLAGTAAAGALGDWFFPFIYNVGIGGFGSSILAWVFLGGLVAVASLQGRPQLTERDEL